MLGEDAVGATGAAAASDEGSDGYVGSHGETWVNSRRLLLASFAVALYGGQMGLIAPYRGDIEDLLPVIDSWHEECNNLPFGLSMDRWCLLEHLDGARDGEFSEVLVAEDCGHPVGFMGLIVTLSELSGERILNEHLWYVSPQFRSRRLASDFILAAEAWGRYMGCVLFLITASRLANQDWQRVGRMYERSGFAPFENVYMRRINGE